MIPLYGIVSVIRQKYLYQLSVFCCCCNRCQTETILLGEIYFCISEFSINVQDSIALGLRCQKTLWQEEYIDKTVHVSQEEVERGGQDKVFACKDIPAGLASPSQMPCPTEYKISQSTTICQGKSLKHMNSWSNFILKPQQIQKLVVCYKVIFYGRKLNIFSFFGQARFLILC